MRNAVAFANNDVATIAWSYGTKPEGCMGFAVYRIDSKGKETPLPSHAVFPGETIEPGQTTEQYPIQKFYWKDVYARLVGDKTGNRTFRYKVVPLEGEPGKLTAMTSLPILTTNEVTISGVCSPSITATFNRGLISTQHVTKALKGKANKGSLLKAIAVEGNQLRIDLAGDILGTLTGFVAPAKKSGSIYAALYELTDVELVRSLVDIGDKLNIVLANIVAKPSPGGSEEEAGENDDSKKSLTDAGASLLYRQPASSHIVHNKFLIYVDDSGTPQAVLTGSCNWTDTGLCAQTNNSIVIQDKAVAARYMAYWKKLQADEKAHQKGGAFQDTPLRTFDGTAKDIKVDQGTEDASTLTSYFSPNTAKARSKSKKAEVMPVDMKDLSARVMAANHAVLFLAFIPGTPSITEFAAAAQKKNSGLFVRGCVTSPDAAGNFFYDLKGTTPPKKQRGVKNPPAPQDPRVISANALDKAVPEGWQQELLKAGFAITHDKIVVIDPFADDCVVVTGSHNLGYQASYNNDENLLLIKGNKKLAMAYATHVLDIYDHFAWRWTVNQGSSAVDAHLKTTPDEWLNKYFDANGDIHNAQLNFWMQATI
jgi:hypothetical protein